MLHPALVKHWEERRQREPDSLFSKLRAPSEESVRKFYKRLRAEQHVDEAVPGLHAVCPHCEYAVVFRRALNLRRGFALKEGRGMTPMALQRLKEDKHAHRDYHLNQRLLLDAIITHSKDHPEQSIAIVVDGTLDSRVPRFASFVGESWVVLASRLYAHSSRPDQAYQAAAIAVEKFGLLDYSLNRGGGHGSFVMFLALDGATKESNVTATQIRKRSISSTRVSPFSCVLSCLETRQRCSGPCAHAVHSRRQWLRVFTFQALSRTETPPCL